MAVEPEAAVDATIQHIVEHEVEGMELGQLVAFDGSGSALAEDAQTKICDWGQAARSGTAHHGSAPDKLGTSLGCLFVRRRPRDPQR